MGGVGPINFLIVPTTISNYVNNVYISEDIEIKESATSKLYNQIKSAFDQYLFVYPIAFTVPGKYINTDNTDNPYFITENIAMLEIGRTIIPYDNIVLYNIVGGDRVISFDYDPTSGRALEIRIKYNPSNKTIFVHNEGY